MVGWEQSDHPIVIFKSGGASNQDEISGINILSLNRHRRYALVSAMSGNILGDLHENRV